MIVEEDIRYIYPFPGYWPFYGQLAHKIFLRTPEATTHVYLHLWGLKAICHDALEPIHAGGRGPRGPRGAPEGPRAERSFAKNKKMLQHFPERFLEKYRNPIYKYWKQM